MVRKLTNISDCVNRVNAAISDGSINFCFINEAPKLVKLISRGGYCAYKNTVYVPVKHLELASSARAKDRSLATAKVLPWVMAIDDGRTNSILDVAKLLYSNSDRCFYFLYEYLFLKAVSNDFSDLVYGGFVNSRRHWWGLRVKPEKVVEMLRSVLRR